MPSDPKRIYWDSCVFISYLQRDADRVDVLDRIVDRAENGDIVLVISAMVIAEVVKLDGHEDHDAATTIKDFFERDYITPRDVDRLTAERAAEISRTHGIKPPDAIHIATALRWHCHCIHTYDGLKPDGSIKGGKNLLKFDKSFGKPPLRIIPPIDPVMPLIK